MRMHQKRIRLCGTSGLDEVGVKLLCSPRLRIRSNNLELAPSRSVFEPNGMQETSRGGEVLQEVAVGPVRV